MLKFGLLIIIANAFLKLFIGIGIWRMAMENKSGPGVKSSLKYEEEKIEEGDPYNLSGQQGGMSGEQDNNSQENEE